MEENKEEENEEQQQHHNMMMALGTAAEDRLLDHDQKMSSSRSWIQIINDITFYTTMVIWALTFIMLFITAFFYRANETWRAWKRKFYKPQLIQSVQHRRRPRPLLLHTKSS